MYFTQKYVPNICAKKIYLCITTFIIFQNDVNNQSSGQVRSRSLGSGA